MHTHTHTHTHLDVDQVRLRRDRSKRVYRVREPDFLDDLVSSRRLGRVQGDEQVPRTLGKTLKAVDVVGHAYSPAEKQTSR